MVLNVALPRIQRELGATQGEQEWAVASYTLVFAALLLPFGTVADRVGRRRTLVGGLLMFAVASAAAAYAGSPLELIVRIRNLTQRSCIRRSPAVLGLGPAV